MIFEYECKKCGKVQEKIHKMNETNTEECEVCKASAEELKKLLSVTPKHVSWTKWRV